jgi:molybdate transport system substrate-binding protein
MYAFGSAAVARPGGLEGPEVMIDQEESGMANAKTIASAACLVLSGALSAGCGKNESGKSQAGKPLHCYVGGTMLLAMQKIAKLYEAQTGQKVEMDSADSGELMIRIQTQEAGDLYVCHDPFLDMLMAKGLGRQSWTMSALTPVIVVPKGNPKAVKSVKDLARPGLKLALTDADFSTMGHVLPSVFDKAGLRKQIEANVVKRARGGGQTANWVIIGEVDAAIVWDAVAFLRKDKLDSVAIEPQYMPIPGIDAVTSATNKVYDIGLIKVTIASLKCSKQPDAAAKFAEFAVANRSVFVDDFGFSPVPDSPAAGTLSLQCGAGLRPAMEDAVKAFEKQTGAKIEASYQGSGTLISAIRLKQQGDLYAPGDVGYLDMLATDGSVEDRRTIAWFVPVIIVQKGNPGKIVSLADLTAPGIRLGMGNPAACQVGRLCEQLWKKNNIDPNVIKDRTVYSSMTVNELGVKVQTDSVDAAIVWDAVAVEFAKDVDIVPIPPARNIYSQVAVGLLKYSRNKPLARQFMDWLAGPRGREIFKRHQYTIDPPAGAGN